MKTITIIRFAALSFMSIVSGSAFAQEGLLLDIKKLVPCKVNIGIDYKNPGRDHKKAVALKDIEIVIFRTQTDLTIIETERGFIKTRDSGTSKMIYFQPLSSAGFTASFPEFKGEHVYCYKAACLDAIGKMAN